MCVQYVFTVPRDDEEVMVSLMQKDVRDQRGTKAEKGGGAKASKKTEPDQHGKNFTIGYHVMKVWLVKGRSWK